MPKTGAGLTIVLALTGAQGSPQGSGIQWLRGPRSWGLSVSPPCSPAAASTGVYVFPVAWRHHETLKGEVTTWLQPLLKANRVLTACQVHGGLPFPLPTPGWPRHGSGAWEGRSAQAQELQILGRRPGPTMGTRSGVRDSALDIQSKGRSSP